MQMHYVEIDIAKDPDIAEAAGVHGTPALQCFLRKERVEDVRGVKMKTFWRELFGRHTEGEDDGESSSGESSTTTIQRETVSGRA